MPLATPTILLRFLLPWMWGISSWLLQQIAATAPYLGRGVSPHSHICYIYIYIIFETVIVKMNKYIDMGTKDKLDK